MALERLASMRYLPIAAIKQEGGADQRRQRFRRALHLQPGARRNRPDVRDHPQGDRRQPLQDRVRPNAMGLRNAFLRFEEVRGADVINSATTYNARSAATARRWRRPTIRWTAARSPTSHRRRSRSTRPRCWPRRSRSTPDFRDNANQRMNAKPRRLLIPPQLEPTAIRLLKTELRPGTANNDVNAILSRRAAFRTAIWSGTT
jgi:hypothetical protein